MPMLNVEWPENGDIFKRVTKCILSFMSLTHALTLVRNILVLPTCDNYMINLP
jgi:hypothetical protein